jgi:hypothetical protein
MLTLMSDARRQKTIKTEARDDLIRYAFLIHTKCSDDSTELSVLACNLGVMCAEKRASSKPVNNDAEKTFDKRCSRIENCVNEIMRLCLNTNGDYESEYSATTSDSDGEETTVAVSRNGNEGRTSDALLHEAVNTIAIMVAGGRSAGHSYVESFIQYASDRKRKSTLLQETNSVIKHIQETLPMSMYKNTLETTMEMLKGVNIAKKDTILEAITRCRCASQQGLDTFSDLIQASSLSNEENKQKLFQVIMNPEDQQNISGCWSGEMAKELFRIVGSTNDASNSAAYNSFLRHSTSTLLRRGYGKLTVAEFHEIMMKVFKSDKEYSHHNVENKTSE